MIYYVMERALRLWMNNLTIWVVVSVVCYRSGIFPVCAPPPLPSLVGSYNLQPPPQNSRAIFLHNDLLCNGMCSLTGSEKLTAGTNGKDPRCEYLICFCDSSGVRDFGACVVWVCVCVRCVCDLSTQMLRVCGCFRGVCVVYARVVYVCL